MVIDEESSGYKLSSVATNVRYSMPELMEQAGLNTVLGMGTTFVVLILLAFLISLFRFIPKIQAAMSKKEETPVPAHLRQHRLRPKKLQRKQRMTLSLRSSRLP